MAAQAYNRAHQVAEADLVESVEITPGALNAVFYKQNDRILVGVTMKDDGTLEAVKNEASGKKQETMKADSLDVAGLFEKYWQASHCPQALGAMTIKNNAFDLATVEVPYCGDQQMLSRTFLVADGIELGARNLGQAEVLANEFAKLTGKLPENIQGFQISVNPNSYTPPQTRYIYKDDGESEQLIISNKVEVTSNKGGEPDSFPLASLDAEDIASCLVKAGINEGKNWTFQALANDGEINYVITQDTTQRFQKGCQPK